MSALSIQVPFPVFNGRDGQPLDNGYVWIGEPNLPPQTNPVAVYFDEALTILAPQPLRTINGYISRAGSPSQVYIDGVNFSILVQDSKGSMVYNFPEGTGISPDACGVIYDPPFTGAVARPVCQKLEETVSVKDFGAVGDGTTDDTVAIKAALQSGNSYIYFPEGEYLVSTIYVTGLSNVALIGVPGASVLKKKAGTYGPNIDGAISGLIDFVSCSYITIDGLKVNGNKANAVPSVGTYLNGINFYLCNIVRTQNSEFVDCNFIGLNHQCCYDVWITNNKFISCGWGGSNFSGGYFAIYGAARCVMANNVYISIWAGVVSQLGVQYMHICDNSFINSSLIFAQDVSQTTISGNTFDGPAPAGALGEAGQDAITIESDSDIVISNNYISASARHGVYVVGNFVENGPKEGILTCNNITIVGNTIVGCTSGSGLQLDPGSAFTYSYVTHTGTPTTEANWTYATNLVAQSNTISGCSVGIAVAIVDGALISSNVCRENITNGINIGGSKNSTYQSNLIVDNSQAGATVYDGIFVNATATLINNITIQANDIYGPSHRYGIYNNNAGVTNLKIKDNPQYASGSVVFSAANGNPNVIVPVTFLNGSSAYGSGLATPSYFKDGDGVVHLRGVALLGAGSVGLPMFNLPVGYRPDSDEIFITLSNQLLARCDVKANGDVVPVIGVNSQYFSLSGISFYAIN